MARASGDRRPLLVAALATTFFAVLGTAATDLSEWYFALRQPAWKPPDALFGPIWTTIFILVALAGATAWRAAPTVAARKRLLAAFVVNGVLNVAWSLLFFGFRRPDWALAEVALLWISIVVMIALARRHSPRAALMLAPYLAWVSLAAALNYEVVRLNAPF
jgi:benzodiazapine receptor